MQITATKVYLPDTPWASTRTGLGQDEQGNTVTFAGDYRSMEGLREALDEQGEIEVELEDWQVLSVLPPADEVVQP